MWQRAISGGGGGSSVNLKEDHLTVSTGSSATLALDFVPTWVFVNRSGSMGVMYGSNPMSFTKEGYYGPNISMTNNQTLKISNPHSVNATWQVIYTDDPDLVDVN